MTRSDLTRTDLSAEKDYIESQHNVLPNMMARGIDIEIYDIDERIASVKLTVDDWVDYMHVYKNENGQWKVINVLWQFNDLTKHTSKQSE